MNISNSAPPVDAVHGAANALLAAIRSSARIDALPAAEPTQLSDAYAVQDAIVAALGPVGGWKVSPLRPGGEPRCSPLPLSFMRTGPVVLDASFLSRCKGEVELAVRLGQDLLPRDGLVSRDEIVASIAAVCPAFELLESRFNGEAPDLHRLADVQNCAGVIVGAGIADWTDIEFADLVCELQIEGGRLASPTPQPSTERTLAAIGWLAGHAMRRGLPLKAGQIVITGARLGPVALGAYGDIVARVGELGDVRIARS